MLWLPHWAYELDGEIDGEIEGDLGEIDETPLVGQLVTPRRQPPGRPRPGPAAPPQVFIAWRFSEALAVGRAAGQRYLWLHDEIRPETVPAAVLPLLDGAMVLSAFHGSQLPAHAAPYEFRTANGLDPQAILVRVRGRVSKPSPYPYPYPYP